MNPLDVVVVLEGLDTVSSSREIVTLVDLQIDVSKLRGTIALVVGEGVYADELVLGVYSGDGREQGAQ